MKSIGIVRKLDDSGRVVLPIEVRKALNIEPKTPVEIFIDGGNIIIKKYNPGCALCGSRDIITDVKSIPVCIECAYEIKTKL